MNISDLKDRLHPKLYSLLSKEFSELRPSQKKAVAAGLLEQKNLLVCTPTASGKTLVGEIACMDSIYKSRGKAVYIVPLKALANEKYDDFRKKYTDIRVALAIGDIDSKDAFLENFDLVICTSEKLDSLIRHRSPWIRHISTVVVDEIHLLNDPSRGPTLEILITILKKLLKNMQFIGLSATIGNPKELAEWLSAELVIDSWRPIDLHQGIYLDGEVEFYNIKKEVK
ncbi:MAG: DEAD/DEAH box helicase [Nanoarchaeota archaeon]|nr:DEAD/DEAH box helicase [Nanoarchaeota archaeon]